MSGNLTKYQPVSVSFTDKRPEGIDLTEDEIGAAIARVSKIGTQVAINCRRRRHSAGSYFACGRDIPENDIEETYVEKEKVFARRHHLHDFLECVGRNPKRCKYVWLKPGVDECADAIVLIVNASQAGRALGLAAYHGNFGVDLIPAAPTCAAVFRPLIDPKRIHVNFVDYFDRDLQARDCFEDGELLLSMTPKLYCSLISAIDLSPHGSQPPTGIPIYPGDKSNFPATLPPSPPGTPPARNRAAAPSPRRGSPRHTPRSPRGRRTGGNR